MPSALQAVLALKAQREAQEQQRSDNLTQGLEMFQKARQQAISNQLVQLKLKQEDKKYNADLEQQVFDNALKTKQQKSMDDYLKLLGGGQPSVASTVTPEVNSVPTLQDAIPTPKPSFVQTPYLSSKGVGVGNKVDPAYSKQLELRNNQIKELEDFASPLEKLADRIENLDKAIDGTPEFKEGFGSKLVAKGTNALADFNNEKWFKDYDLAFNKSFLPAAQAENMSKVMSDLDLKTQISSLGDPTAPRAVKKEALKQIRDSLGKYSASKVSAFGADKKVLSKIYPNASRVFGLGDSGEFNPETHKKQINKKTGEIRIVPR